MFNLPGNPSDAGPDTRNTEPEPEWDDLLMYAEEETCFARRRHRANTPDDRRLLVEAIMRAESFLESAKAALHAR